MADSSPQRPKAERSTSPRASQSPSTGSDRGSARMLPSGSGSCLPLATSLRDSIGRDGAGSGSEFSTSKVATASSSGRKSLTRSAPVQSRSLSPPSPKRTISSRSYKSEEEDEIDEDTFQLDFSRASVDNARRPTSDADLLSREVRDDLSIQIVPYEREWEELFLERPPREILIEAIWEGVLEKRGPGGPFKSRWQPRHCYVMYNFLFYYKERAFKGAVPLQDVVVRTCDTFQGHPHVFELRSCFRRRPNRPAGEHGVFHFSAPTSNEMDAALSAIQRGKLWVQPFSSQSEQREVLYHKCNVTPTSRKSKRGGSRRSGGRDSGPRIRPMSTRDKRKTKKPGAKLLLLGVSHSGKTTVMKQMQILFGDGMPVDKRANFTPYIHANMWVTMKYLVLVAQSLGLEFEETYEADIKQLMEKDWGTKLDLLTRSGFDMLLRLWRHPCVVEVRTRVDRDASPETLTEVSESYLSLDNAPYFFERISTIRSDNYVPSKQDVLNSRHGTTDAKETSFTMESFPFTVVDVGGQRPERRKWLNVSGVTAIIFTVDVHAYDKYTMTNEKVNKLHESLEVFGEAINTEEFIDTPVIVFLNKKDLFVKKIKEVDLRCCFPQYKGGADLERAEQYISGKLCELNENPKRQLYITLMCATDTNNINFVFHATREIFLRDALNSFMW